jgi:hypothetical protein
VLAAFYSAERVGFQPNGKRRALQHSRDSPLFQPRYRLSHMMTGQSYGREVN